MPVFDVKITILEALRPFTTRSFTNIGLGDLFLYGNLKKFAAEAHRLLVEAYGDAALSERSCREWFQKFKNGEFDIEQRT